MNNLALGAMVAFLFLCLVGVLVHVWFGKPNRPEELEFKADEYVNDAMQAERSRAETRIAELSDLDAAKEIDKNFGGPK